jgi:hypothetical protein
MNNGNVVKQALHLIIAEDIDWWSEKLQGLEEPLRDWSLARTGQFDLAVHACRSVESFDKLVGSLLSDGALVYATLDLRMPIGEGEETPDPEAGERMIDSCLEWKRQGQSLEFCLVSELDDSLDRLYRNSSELRKLGIRKIYKSQLQGINGQRILLDVLFDIQSFVRRHLAFCTIELPAGSGNRVPVWFGGKEPLLDLLNRADHIASEDAGIYVLFAEAGGYEFDWVKLCCDLRGVQLTDLDIAKADTMFHPEWKAPFQNPPEALLVRNIDHANERGCDIAPLLEQERFFDKVVARNSLAFFQFPLLATKLDYSKLDETVEVPILKSCIDYLNQNHPPGSRQPGRTLAFEEHRRTVTFPSYNALRKAGVVRKTIEFEVAESQRQTGCPGVLIDPELFELLNEIPWDQRDGFHQLRRSIRVAYVNFANSGRGGSFLREEHFRNSVVAEESRGKLGFLVRGRRLYQVLETRGTALGTAEEAREGRSEAEEALRSLEDLWQLYDGLQRLRALRDQLGFQPSDKDFTPQDYDTLHQARSFLDSLFDNPESLRQLIDAFRPHLKRRAWRDYYPALDDSRMAAVENIGFTWPFSHLPLHPSVFAYLQQNGVSPLIHKEIEESLQRFYPDLEARWEDAKRDRIELRKEMMRREVERKRAERYAREAHSQPVLVHLVPRVSVGEVRSPFQKILHSFLLFNSYLGLAENHYTFKSRMFIDKKDLRSVLDRVELGHMVGFLSRYIKKVGTSEEEERSLSVFVRWTDRWAEKEHKDAVRLARQIAQHMLSAEKYKDGWHPKEEQPILEKIGSLECAHEARCSVGTILNFFRILRNAYGKATGADFERDYAQHLRDFLRRFLAATTEAYRIGRVREGGVIDLWRKEAGEQAEPGRLLAEAPLWQGRLVLAREVAAPDSGETIYEVRFPIDDLIRLRPILDSVWAYQRNIWLNLTHLEGSEEAARLSSKKETWLPDDKALTSSELWTSIHHD